LAHFAVYAVGGSGNDCYRNALVQRVGFQFFSVWRPSSSGMFRSSTIREGNCLRAVFRKKVQHLPAVLYKDQPQRCVHRMAGFCHPIFIIGIVIGV
jgi:hypothetical protein